ncbi:MAG TPA: hypothetical protein PK765_00065 [bacterium]|nr:hypothetical protein [bacterium]
MAPIIIQTPADGCNAARSILSHFQKSASLPQQEARDILVSQL